MLSLTRSRQDARLIFDAALKAADPADAVRRHVRVGGEILTIGERHYNLASYERVFVVGAGKASAKMALAVEDLLGERLSGGVVNVKYGHSVLLRFTKVNEAGHPIPDQAGAQAANEIASLLEMAGERDFVLFLLSGGGSALLPCPVAGVTLEDEQKTTQVLLECGAKIQEINAIRKHISKLRGGRLAQLAYPATIVSLILSDVIGDIIDIIAGGPTAPDRSTFSDCLRILAKYGIQRKIPLPVMRLLEQGVKGKIEETPKPSDPIFLYGQNVIIGNNRLALSAAKQKAEELEYQSLILSSFIEGETKEVATVHAAIAKEIRATGHPIRTPACVVSGGETTVTVRGRGLGGRNQEFALATAIGIEGLEGVVVLSGGTDGFDGPTDAAGALADGTTIARGRAKGMEAQEYLQNNDSYHFFRELDDLLITGPTFTNVMDIRIVLVG